jgi:integrase
MPRRRRRVCGSIDRRGNGFRIRIQVAGLKRTETVRHTARSVAEARAEQLMDELEREAEKRAARTVTAHAMSELFSRFMREIGPTLAAGTEQAYGDTIKSLRLYFVDELHDPAVEEMRPSQVHGYLTWRRAHRIGGTDPVSNRTIAKDRAVLHRMFNFAVRQLEWCGNNPVAAVKPPKADRWTPTILDEAQYEALLTACATRPMLQLYVLLLGETGARCASEALWLRWEDVDLENGFLRIVTGRNGHRTKSGRARTVPISDRLIRAMRKHFVAYRAASYSGRPTPWVFHHDHTSRHYEAGQRVGSLYVGFKNAVKRAKLPAAVRQHDLRHRRVTSWLEQGHSPVLVKEAMGHASLSTTMGYSHLVAAHLKTLVAPVARSQKRAVAG